MAALWKCKQVFSHLGDFEQLLREPMKRSTVFMTYFQSSCHFVNVNKILLSENF